MFASLFNSQAVIADKTMYISGQLGLNPEVLLMKLHHCIRKAGFNNLSALFLSGGSGVVC